MSENALIRKLPKILISMRLTNICNINKCSHFIYLDLLIKLLFQWLRKNDKFYYMFIILNGRFSFKSNFIPGENFTRFIPGWNSRLNRIVFIAGRVSSRDEILCQLHVNALLSSNQNYIKSIMAHRSGKY